MKGNLMGKVGGHTDHYDAALRAALNDLADAQRDTNAAREWLHEAEGRVQSLTVLANHLFGELPLDRQQAYADRLEELRVSTSQSRHSSTMQQSNRSTVVYDNVVQLFTTQRKEWTAAEVQEALSNNCIGADPKAVYNVLSYLARKGRLHRMAKGQYVWVDGGVGITFGEDLAAADQNGGSPMED